MTRPLSPAFIVALERITRQAWESCYTTALVGPRLTYRERLERDELARYKFRKAVHDWQKANP